MCLAVSQYASSTHSIIFAGSSEYSSAIETTVDLSPTRCSPTILIVPEPPTWESTSRPLKKKGCVFGVFGVFCWGLGVFRSVLGGVSRVCLRVCLGVFWHLRDLSALYFVLEQERESEPDRP